MSRACPGAFPLIILMEPSQLLIWSQVLIMEKTKEKYKAKQKFRHDGHYLMEVLSLSITI